MQTNLADFIKHTPQGQEADRILRKCVHCGFCLATCPTYNLLGDELDSPRGRIYLMKQMLEGAPVTAKTQLHLDRCLTCRACETTCPSGVEYGKLVDIGRDLVEKKVGRGIGDGLKRLIIRKGLLQPTLFAMGLALGRAFKGLLPDALAKKVPARRPSGDWPAARHARRMLVLDGCVQPALAPDINAATARVLDRLGISLIRADQASCCGALSYHLNAQEEALGFVKRNIDAWWPHADNGVEAIVITASGCGTMVHEYGHLLRNDPVYAQKAARISALCKDVSEVISSERNAVRELLTARPKLTPMKVAFHSPCSLQHGLKIRGVVEELLQDAGCALTAVPDSHLCCGSAGTYSLLQPELSQQLLKNKVIALETGAPDLIATANIGCLTHIESGAGRPVKHWIEILDARLGSP
jgi:glycolate oxidase iron-sulfur subunit